VVTKYDSTVVRLLFDLASQSNGGGIASNVSRKASNRSRILVVTTVLWSAPVEHSAKATTGFYRCYIFFLYNFSLQAFGHGRSLELLTWIAPMEMASIAVPSKTNEGREHQIWALWDLEIFRLHDFRIKCLITKIFEGISKIQQACDHSRFFEHQIF